jgi:hypothetical protein
MPHFVRCRKNGGLKIQRNTVSGLVLGLALGSAAGASTWQSGAPAFETQTRQSSWGRGEAQRLGDSLTFSTPLDAGPLTLDEITGSRSVTTLPNPARAEWNACRAANAVAGFFGGSIDCGSTPPTVINAVLDSRAGAQLSVEVNGEIGAQFDYLDAGSVDVDLQYSANLDLPDAPMASGTRVAFNPMSTWVDGMIDAQSPTLVASVSSVFELDLGCRAECIGARRRPAPRLHRCGGRPRYRPRSARRRRQVRAVA